MVQEMLADDDDGGGGGGCRRVRRVVGVKLACWWRLSESEG